MHPGYVHDYIQPGFEHQLQYNALIARESIQYLFFQWPGKRFKMGKRHWDEN
jgi:hypothetical protein